MTFDPDLVLLYEHNITCPKDFTRWALRNHPDKHPDGKKVEPLFQEVNGLVQHCKEQQLFPLKIPPDWREQLKRQKSNRFHPNNSFSYEDVFRHFNTDDLFDQFFGAKYRSTQRDSTPRPRTKPGPKKPSWNYDKNTYTPGTKANKDATQKRKENLKKKTKKDADNPSAAKSSKKSKRTPAPPQDATPPPPPFTPNPIFCAYLFPFKNRDKVKQCQAHHLPNEKYCANHKMTMGL